MNEVWKNGVANSRGRPTNYQSGNDGNLDITCRGNTDDKEFTRETYYADEYFELSFAHTEEILSARRRFSCSRYTPEFQFPRELHAACNPFVCLRHIFSRSRERSGGQEDNPEIVN